MIESRAVWKDLGSRDRVRVRSDIKGQGFLIVYACTIEIKSNDVEQWNRVKGMMSGHM